EVFDEPEVFRPERFLLSEHGTKPGVDSKDWRASIPFGSGRRLCPGINLVNTNLAFTIATLVWAFDFAAAIDPVTKAPIPVDIDAYEEGLVFRPRPFACSISPRSEAKARLIRQRFTDATPAFSKYELFLTKEEK
ncbi:cytochrome P450, partial [Suillus fuscotomentosus]